MLPRETPAGMFRPQESTLTLPANLKENWAALASDRRDAA
jgi:hypothetical protein